MIATDIRLRMPETFPIHNALIDWSGAPSRIGIPAQALGLPRMTLALMRWASRDWTRMNRLNRLGGTLTAGVQMDLLPAIGSAALFTVTLPHSERDPVSLLGAGENLQRFWVAADRLGLALQPMLAILAFAHYGAKAENFTVDASLPPKAKTLASKLQAAVGSSIDDLLFIGRIGEPKPRGVKPRSIRKPLSELVVEDARSDQAAKASA